MRNAGSVAELRKSLFAGIKKVENREGLEKLRAKISVASSGKVVMRMTAGGKRMYVVLASQVLPPEARRQSCLSTEVNNNV
jgi:hypothetical protein